MESLEMLVPQQSLSPKHRVIYELESQTLRVQIPTLPLHSCDAEQVTLQPLSLNFFNLETDKNHRSYFIGL